MGPSCLLFPRQDGCSLTCSVGEKVQAPFLVIVVQVLRCTLIGYLPHPSANFCGQGLPPSGLLTPESLLHPELVVEPHLGHTGLMARKEVAPKQDLGAAACRRKGYWEGTRKTTGGSLMSFSGSNNPALIILTILVVQMAKSLPAMQYTWVQSLGPEDPLKKEMETYSSILDWKFHGQRSLVGLQAMGSQRAGHD